MKKKDKIQKTVKSGKNTALRMSSSTFPKVEAAMVKWLQDVRDKNGAINGVQLMERAAQFAVLIPDEKHFKASTGWLKGFMKRNEVIHRTLKGEANSVNLEDVENFKTDKLAGILQRYHVNDIFNYDEAGLQYGATSRKTLTFKGDTAHGTKEDKRRLTLLFCANMSGLEKKQLLAIGRFNNPRDMPSWKKRPCHYTANTKSWMTSEIFQNWLEKWNRNLANKGRKIALVLDNATCHPKITLSNIELEFLPPNTTSHIQPMDQGIIANFKRHHRHYYIMAHLCPAIEAGRSPDKITMFPALEFCVQAWNNVTARTIARCFRRAGFINPAVPQNTPEEEEEENLPLAVLAERLTTVAQLPHTPEDVDRVLNEVEDVAYDTCGALTDQEIVNEVTLDADGEALPDHEEIDEDQIPTEPIKKPCSYAQALMYMEELKLYASCTQGPESDEMYADALRMHARIIRVLPKQRQATMDQYLTTAQV